jgi:predicted secreted protein
MSITSAIVLFAVIWFMVLFVVLPLRLTTQGEAGNVTPGTPESAPADPRIGRKMRLVTVIAAVLWVVIAGVILSGAISVRDLDWFGRMSRQAPADGRGG